MSENDVTGRPHSVLKPDLVITDPGSRRSVPIDVKYKTYDSRKISTADIYQTFLYAYALGGDDREPRVGIIYPAQSPVNGPRLSVSPAGGRVAARIIGSGIDLPAALDDLRFGRKGPLLQQVRTSIEATTGFCVAVPT